MEITPNFANSGRFYLTGLAVTDSPASLGTQELYFSRRSHDSAYFADSMPLGSLREPSQQRSELGRLFSTLTGLFKSFAEIESTTPATPSPDEKKPMDEATAKALKALYDQFVILLAGLQAVLEPVVEDVDASDNQEQVDAVGSAVQDVVDQADEERGEFKKNGDKNIKELSTRMAELEQTMTKMFNTPANRRQVPRTTGATGKQRPKGLR